MKTVVTAGGSGDGAPCSIAWEIKTDRLLLRCVRYHRVRLPNDSFGRITRQAALKAAGFRNCVWVIKECIPFDTATG